MANKKFQRIGIWVIVIVFSFGAVGTFAALILSTQNDAEKQQNITKLNQEYQSKVSAQTAELSSTYFKEFSPFKERVAKFDSKSVTKIASKDLKKGDGVAIKDDSTYSAYYIGWNPDGKIFDSSLDTSNGLKAPLSVYPGGVITGWAEAVKGMKTGGIREISIPSEKAYGETGSGSLIPPNTPLKFVVMVIPTPAEIEIPQELIDYYYSQQ